MVIPVDDDEGWGGEQAYFVDCTCEHDPDEHTWGLCAVEDCPCEGGWEEL